MIEKQADEIKELSIIKSKLEPELNKIPETWRTVVQMNDVWQKNCKFEGLNRLLSITERVPVSDVDSSLLNRSKQLMDQVEDQHAQLNDEIAALKNAKEQKPVLSKRLENLDDLLSKLNQVLTVCDLKRNVLVHKNSQLDNWIKGLSNKGDNDQLNDDGDYVFVDVQNEQFNSLMQQKKNYENACEVLQQQSELFLDSLKYNEQLLNELKTRQTVEEKNKENEEIDDQLKNK